MNLLLAEDDTLLADALQQQLMNAAFKVEWAENGAVAEYLLRKQDFDVAVLDLGLPMVDGLTVLKRVREAGRTLPILVLTALDALEHRVAGLQAGADDYLTKPFDFPELEARLHALLRRSRPAGAAVQLRGLSLDRGARRASVAGQPLELSPREWTLLDLLLTERDRVVTKAQIVEAWGVDEGGSIEVYIHRLRKKLEGSGLAVRTVRGLGYLLEATAS
ncbi:response regulator transcription factor [Pelomonas aquatica]|jgi:two-component system OmpR family response regulator|uniref:Response regulator transcription factor n=1 Tax=Pelomonas aquatica TaxID=431058 RepID=A0A9X4LLI9_9BURK|nr:response regulator transcription factor [Pelomonas aquatica]MCY4753661.1 response regulator transcription factor [Pelomonas aquatica]MDG0864999.1 response regulator transcription factor [Pelomonas aquatica]